ncbi:unnamed protein product [Schistocephalus solidus]|uniref:C2H2-type domain-containing protein n=1 Tax=Schistocephalus solidus TaxID=70667 RepID=A0A183SGX6_SCHSO|nr:unnamed protein product [Schistocephalus solidus]
MPGTSASQNFISTGQKSGCIPTFSVSVGNISRFANLPYSPSGPSLIERESGVCHTQAPKILPFVGHTTQQTVYYCTPNNSCPAYTSEAARNSVLASTTPISSCSLTTTLTLPFTATKASLVPASSDCDRKLMSEADTSVAIAAYTKYYTDVLAYFKALLNAIEDPPTDPKASHPKVTSHQAPGSAQYNQIPDPTVDPWEHSKTVMDGYFSRLEGTRNWDWASWHNYLSWISRTHPEWFRLFTDCSKQMGINWDEMYQKWLSSQAVVESKPHVFDTSCPPPIETPSHIQSMSNGVTFRPPPPLAFTSQPPPPIPPEDPRIWCEDCDQYFETNRAFDIHFRGVKHIQNALTKTITRNPNIVLDIPTSQTTQWNLVDIFRSLTIYFKISNHLILTNVLFLFKAHSNQYLPVNQGVFHNRYLPPRGPFNKPDDTKTTEKRPKVHLRLQQLLDICIQPLIGLNYIVEFQRRGLLDCLYACDLCNSAFLPSNIIKHKQHYPPLYYMLSKDKGNKTFKTKRLAAYAQKIEDFEGRKRLSVMREKENSSFRSFEGCAASVDRKTRTLKEHHPQDNSESAAIAQVEKDHATAREKPSKIKQEKCKSAKSEDDEIEEGEMTDDSSSSSSEEEQEVEAACSGKNARIDVNAFDGGDREVPLFGSVASPASASSSSFSACTSDEENEPPKPAEARAASSDSLHGGYVHQAHSRSTGPHIHLSDFEPLFVSERPLVPIFVSKDDDFNSLLQKLSSAGLIRLVPNTEDCATTDDAKFSKQSEAVVSPDDPAAAQSFEDEVQWALRRLESLPYKPNENQLLFKLPVSEQSAMSPVSTTTGRSIEVLCSSKVPALPLRSCHPYVDADFIHSYEPPLIAGPLQPIPVVASPPTRLRMPPPPPLKFGNSIPVITSRVRPGITVMPELPLEPPQPPRPSRPVVLVAKRQQSVLGDPPLRKPQEVPPTRPSPTPGIQQLLSSPLEALQRLLKDGYNPLPSNPSEATEPNPPASRSPNLRPLNAALPSRLEEGGEDDEPKKNCLLSPPPPPSEFFDGYSFFSQRSERRKRRQESFTSSTAVSTSRSSPTPPPSAIQPKKKLAAIADMLGLNEPPAPKDQAVAQSSTGTPVPPFWGALHGVAAHGSAAAVGLQPPVAAGLNSTNLWSLLCPGLVSSPYLMPPSSGYSLLGSPATAAAALRILNAGTTPTSKSGGGAGGHH